MPPEDKLREIGIMLPEAPSPLGSYVPFVKVGNLVYLSGILPLRQGKLDRQGKVGERIGIDEAREDARTAVINALSILRSSLGSLDKVKKCIRIAGYVASAPDFTEQHKVLNAASDLIYEIFGDRGRHARVAVGVNVLPLDSPVEIEFIFEVS